MTRSPASPLSERRRFVVIGLGGLAGFAPSAGDEMRRSPDPLDAEEAARVLKALAARSSLKPG